jgi:hypothetical protein
MSGRPTVQSVKRTRAMWMTAGLVIVLRAFMVQPAETARAAASQQAAPGPVARAPVAQTGKPTASKGTEAGSGADFYWTDWKGADLDPGPGFKAKGTIMTATAEVTVTYTNSRGVGFYQPAGGTDYWVDQRRRRDPGTSPYTSTLVPNIPTGTDLIALSKRSSQTLEFSQPIATPVFAFVSLNGNGYAFDQDFEILSVGGVGGKECGYWGCGGVSKVVVDRGGGVLEYQLNCNNVGGGEPHGTIRFTGTFSKMTWQSSSDEYWNGFTVGVQGTAEEVNSPSGWVAVGDVAGSVLSPRMELILDASGSMKEIKRRIDGKLKIDVAKEVLTDIVRRLPAGMEVALRVYGHRVREGQRGACQDSELMVPFARDRQQILQRIAGIQALGTTPIAYSLQQAATDFAAESRERLVVLVTDGKEECGGDPVKAVQRLIAAGAKPRVNIVGFALADEQTKEEMRKTSALTGGGFFDAQDRSGLDKALNEAMAVPFRVFHESGKEAARGAVGQGAVQLPVGVYTLAVEGAEPIRIESIAVKADQYTLVELKKEAGRSGRRVLGALTEKEAREALPSAFRAPGSEPQRKDPHRE